ncbi:MAG: MBL fold metallo-hydrolase [Flavobacteriales bacterium]|nr:MBL fold metallo-hydrolase [Flavobacteriales bacterium]
MTNQQGDPRPPTAIGVSIQFLGASSGIVTGSKYLVRTPGINILVDCGLFQGDKRSRALNWEAPPVDVAGIDLVLLTHGHLDHTGFLPRLVNLGFKGRILATGPTLKIAEIILKDTAKIQEEEAERANREGYSKHLPAKPLYDLKDVERTAALFEEITEGEWITLAATIKARFQYVGHIIGATFIELDIAGERIVLSGDVGRKEDILLHPPKRPERADVLLIESTYGDRVHIGEEDAIRQLADVVNETIARGGSMFIPSFAVERTQLLMLALWRLLEEGSIPRIPMVIDSPMGVSVLDLFHHSRTWHKLAPEECTRMCAHFRRTMRFQETLQLRKDNEPKIVIAGSGMVTGGRILNYLEYRAGNTKDTLLFVGYQAEGTKGRALLEGATTLRVYGKVVPFKMQVRCIDGLSAHGDQRDLLWWLELVKDPPRKVFIVHGEKDAALAFRKSLLEQRGWEAELPVLNEQVNIS